jgi:hypothetical protein
VFPVHFASKLQLQFRQGHSVLDKLGTPFPFPDKLLSLFGGPKVQVLDGGPWSAGTTDPKVSRSESSNLIRSTPKSRRLGQVVSVVQAETIGFAAEFKTCLSQTRVVRRADFQEIVSSGVHELAHFQIRSFAVFLENAAEMSVGLLTHDLQTRSRKFGFGAVRLV